LIEITLAPYRSDRMPAKISGPETLLPAQHVTPLGLVLHELTTNAVKYGAWANGGLLTVNWQITNGQLILNWTEACEIAEIEPASEGFGSMLMVSAARQLGGTIERSFAPHGVHVGIVIPLEV
jgi:two-component sensor histidine kinase